MLKWLKASRAGNTVPEPAPVAQAERPVFEFVAEGWERQQHDSRIKGWAVDSIVAANRTAWPFFVAAINGGQALAVTPEAPPGTAPSLAAQNAMLAFAYVVALAAGKREHVSVLDWGGAIGQHALVARRMVPHVSLDYHSVDMPGLSALGRELNSDVTFHDSTAGSFFERTYDLVMASGSLQYVADWRAIFARLAHSTGTYLYLARLPTVAHVPSFVMVQRPYAFGYDTEYLSWCINRDELIEAAKACGLKVFREFLGSDSIQIINAPEQCQFQSVLFCRDRGATR